MIYNSSPDPKSNQTFISARKDSFLVVTEMLQKVKDRPVGAVLGPKGMPMTYDFIPSDFKNPSCSFCATGYFAISAAVFRINGLPDCFSVSSWKWWNFA